MKIGIPREIKNNENRVGLSPSGVHALVESGHTVLVETNAGSGSFFEDVDTKKQVLRLLLNKQKFGMWIWLLKLKNHLNLNIHILKKGLYYSLIFI
ncbi:hypothetical protein [Staphylococcus aureus]|uniref:hypothetical protein n=1 Tax=Staphylococcus aureus TaxID=1280 RepID=UPI00298801B2|nr:hypothetical protein [Staphylococcus aureus]